MSQNLLSFLESTQVLYDLSKKNLTKAESTLATAAATAPPV